MAVQDTDFLGTARLTDGFTIGFVPQEPRLDAEQDVRDNVEEAVAATRALLAKQEEIGNKMAEASAEELDKLSNQMDKVQDQIDAANAWDLDRHLEIAMDAMRLPPGDAPVEQLSGGERRRVALCKMLLQKPDLLLLDEPTNHLDAESVAWLERHLQEYPGTVVSVTHDRYFLDNVAQWILELDRGQGIPWKGNYSSWLEQKAGTAGGKRKRPESARQKTLAARTGMGPHGPAGPDRPRARPVSPPTKSWRARNTRSARTSWSCRSRRGRTSAIWWCGPKGVKKGFGDNLLMEDLNFDLPKGGIVGVIGPNGAGKTTLFKMIVGQEKPDGGKLTVGPTVQAGPRRSEPRRARRRTRRSSRRSPAAPTTCMLGKRKVASPRLRGAVQLQGARPAEQGRRAAPAANATASTWRSCSAAAATCCCSTSRPTTSTWTRCGPSKKRF